MAAANRGRSKGRGRDETLPPLVVRYHKRMRCQKVYCVEVTWGARRKQELPGSEDLTVRLLVAGAQVVPSEHTLDPAKPKVKALFYVTPLARGWLRGERLEVARGGKKIQEIKLPAKVTSQRPTFWLLLLSLLVPWFLIGCIMAVPTTEEYNGIVYYSPGARIATFIEQNSPPVLPQITHLDEQLPDDFKLRDRLIDSRDVVGNSFDFVYFSLKNEPIAWYITAGLLGLTLLSFWWHREKQTRRTGKPLPAPADGADDEDEEHGGRRQAVGVAEDED